METGRENCDTGIVQENGMRSYWQEDGAAGRKSIYVYGQGDWYVVMSDENFLCGDWLP